jgi:glycosyltransferase involved in cell wall biosynthesis
MEQGIRLNVSESLQARRRISRHTLVLSTSEKVAIPLAAMLAIANAPVPHVVMAHRLSSRFKTSLFRVWPVQRAFSQVICFCRSQADFAVRHLGIPASRVDFIHAQVDSHFFRPQNGGGGQYVLSVGQERRDYETLFDALSGTGINLVVIASSRWSSREQRMRLKGAENVSIQRHISFEELRQLYAGARVVIVPLKDVNYAAGVNTVLEAMAMAKPLIVSSTAGIQDYVIHNETGHYIAPGDAAELRDAILNLWHQAGERKRLGENARQAVEEQMNLENYVCRVVEIMRRAEATAW